MEINELNKKYRKEAGMTQEQVADKLFVQRSAYAHYESGKRRIDAKMYFKIAEIFGVEVSLKERGEMESRLQTEKIELQKTKMTLNELKDAIKRREKETFNYVTGSLRSFFPSTRHVEQIKWQEGQETAACVAWLEEGLVSVPFINRSLDVAENPEWVPCAELTLIRVMDGKEAKKAAKAMSMSVPEEAIRGAKTKAPSESAVLKNEALVIEAPFMLAILGSIMQRNGYEIREAGSFEEGVRQLSIYSAYQRLAYRAGTVAGAERSGNPRMALEALRRRKGSFATGQVFGEKVEYLVGERARQEKAPSLRGRFFTPGRNEKFQNIQQNCPFPAFSFVAPRKRKSLFIVI